MRPYVGQPETEQELSDDELPPLLVSLLPVVLPVILIATNTLASAVLDAEAAGSQRVLSITANLGNPNFALLLSAAISIWMVIQYRHVTLARMSESIEQALMSGGIVILITAAGGAFGKMLAEAGIKETIQGALGGESSVAGIAVLLAAFGVAAMMKFAQGSGTVSMITTSSMFAAMGFTPEQLGFNLIYLATAIGSGSLVGDWMNNSGFWVFSRMSVLTTEETLKTWTILTAALGITGFIVTVIGAMLLPLM
jgi:GntP family gluconate:H+ symporter